ncbi:hypothetical protein EAF00_010853 [Botryotinia globosa]|nr:hypothetical protein EAF00_010853 [Botryotinia globosa]
MGTGMEDVHYIIDTSVHRGLKDNDMENEGLEEGQLIGSPPHIPLFKSFSLTTSEAKDKADRLAKTEIWEETINREKTRVHFMDSVEGAACTRKAQTKVPPVSSTSSPLPQDSMHNTPRQGSMDSEMSDRTEEEREQAIHSGMYGDAYVDIYSDVYWDTNVDIHEENLVSEKLSRTRQREKERRQRLSALDNVELVGKRIEEREQEILVLERIRSSIKNTESRGVPAKICDISEKINLEMAKERAALPGQDSSLHAQSTHQKPWQNTSSVISNGSQEGSQLEREQGHRATGGTGDGELFPALKDARFLPENLDMEIDTVVEYRNKEDVVKSFSIPQNFGDMSDDARRHGTKIGEALQETPLRSSAMVEHPSKDIWPRSIPKVLSPLFCLSEEVEEITKMENE